MGCLLSGSPARGAFPGRLAQ
ncbi:hypothetical protein SeLEV6574_g08649, partial [Synchytrium endobioticum]